MTRAKQTALLVDRLLLEGGSLLLRVEGEVIAERWLRPIAPGSGPARAEQRVFAQDVVPGPVVSFDTLLDALRIMDVKWAGVVVPPADDTDRALLEPGSDTVNSLPSSAWLGSALRRDLAVARRLDAALVATPAFGRLLFPEDEMVPRPRAIVSPDPSQLTWEQLVELRDHGSTWAARRLMREILELHRPSDPEPMLTTVDVLADDISGLLSDAFDAVAVDATELIVTRLAAAWLRGGSVPTFVMETHPA